MFEEGCDVEVLPGKITDESVIARPAGMITLHLTAAPALGRSASNEGGRSRQMQSDHAGWPGNHAFISDFAGQDFDIASFLEHCQPTNGQSKLRGDLRVRRL